MYEISDRINRKNHHNKYLYRYIILYNHNIPIPTSCLFLSPHFFFFFDDLSLQFLSFAINKRFSVYFQLYYTLSSDRTHRGPTKFGFSAYPQSSSYHRVTGFESRELQEEAQNRRVSHWTDYSTKYY